LGITSVVVSHDVDETFQISDHVVILANGKVAAQGTPAELRQTSDPLIHQFVNGLSDGPVHFHYPATSVAEDFGRGHA
jgi:phospholipid/cholesterol/gamma-HCH transport system ATP-binding protein